MPDPEVPQEPVPQEPVKFDTKPPEVLVPKTAVLSTNAGIPSGTVLQTPQGMPNIVVKAVSPWKRVVVRVARVYLQSLVGFLPVAFGGGQALANAMSPGTIVLPHEFLQQMLFAASLALAPSFSTLLGNLLEWLVKQDQM